MTENTHEHDALIEEDVIDPEPGWTSIDVAAEENEARENFTLVDLFSGPSRPGSLPEKTRLLFLKPELVERYDTLRLVVARKKEMLKSSIGPDKPKRGASAEAKAEYQEYVDARAALEAEVVDDEASVEEAKTEMLEHSVSFHMRAYPQIALKVAKREARKMFIDPQTGQLREGYDPADYQEWLDLRLFGETVLKVVRSDGQEVGFGVPKAELGEMLSNAQNLHPAAWKTLWDDFEELTLRAGIRMRAVEDPGF